uniref:NADH-ubiquinone oxidoreductase chain 6 n=1 Tax=Aleocharinae sp. 6 EF-2015 TaxID=1756848 RepID=A0A0S2M8Q8_9COLE|nr:NADH deshydrogenase subunit 6 [Aleocharinae sp. 6 EF-2015]
MFMAMNFFLSLIFLVLNHPMTMGLTLLLQTLIISLITGFLNSNFWFSYILFLIMIGGMLVLFIYMTSIASNEMFSYSNMILIMLFIFILLTISSFFLDSVLTSMSYTYIENNQSHSLNLNLIKYFNYPSMFMIFFMIIYLFITLIAVVKITQIEFGPLRQKI